ncbi:hypothetical protein [Pseudohalocynthiibacter sp. F2068]|uniref:hypothetical protein n=1 Tax=Pseudohalocynthiibacter sp. F2068 TaxID=2926418 RepID=UPI001FF2C0EA|nr:hypothetical protein [Pseudohalocynthiibacter sp. F2068]MCK0104394.1 hypothetical protein [Pseudohalocynthiibacter sp. F2068]
MITIRLLRTVMAWGETRTRTFLERPYPLPYAHAPSVRFGGGQTRLYTLADIISRLKLLNHPPSAEQFRNLFEGRVSGRMEQK